MKFLGGGFKTFAAKVFPSPLTPWQALQCLKKISRPIPKFTVSAKACGAHNNKTPTIKSEKYIEECNKKNILPDLKQIQGMTSEDILLTFYETLNFKKDKHGWSSKLDLNFLKSKVINYSLMDSSNGNVVIKNNHSSKHFFLLFHFKLKFVYLY